MKNIVQAHGNSVIGFNRARIFNWSSAILQQIAQKTFGNTAIINYSVSNKHVLSMEAFIMKPA